MKPIEGGVCAPAGFQASGISAQIKNLQSTKKDCALIFSSAPANIAGCFTRNRVKAAPVKWTEGVCIRGQARAVFINSGNANACTGGQGITDAQETAEAVALALDIPVTEVAIMSTGVIGQPLPMDRIRNGVALSVAALSGQGGADAAAAIMTTDTRPKETAVEVDLGHGKVRIGAIAKGAGMIAPNMATLLSVIATDASISPDDLAELLRECVAVSFNCICVDNDMSTNDTVVCLANGQSGTPPLAAGTEAFALFAAGLQAVCVELAQGLVRDGEGVTKFIEVQVAGAPDRAAARAIAKSISESMLVKTAFAGEDANWGRIACAAGYSGVEFEQSDLSIWLDGLQLVENGVPTGYAEADAATIMKRPEITVRVDVGSGKGTCTFWTCDLTHEYISINADYRS